MTFLDSRLTLLCLVSLLAPALGCGARVEPIEPDAAALDANSADAAAPDALPVDAFVLDAATADAADASPGVTSCVDGVRAIAHDEGGVRALGLAPLGDGWAVAYEALGAHFLARLDGEGAPIGEPSPYERATAFGRGAIVMRPLEDGVLVRSGTGVRFFLGDGSEPFVGTAGLAPLVLGPSSGSAVMGISGNDVVRITLGDAGLSVERFPTGLDLSGHGEPTDGYLTSRSMGVSADGCLALASLTFAYDTPSTLRTLPVIAGAACADVTHSWAAAGSFGVFDSLGDGRFVTVVGLYPGAEVSRAHLARLETLGGEAPVAEGETFGIPLSYGVRAAIASAPDRTIVATMHASGYGESQVFLWRSIGGTPEAITSDGRSENSAVYLAWHPTLDRVAAIYGTDSPGSSQPEQTLGLRCDL